MQLILNSKDTLLFDEFKFKCSIGKNGFTSKKIEGDKKTPKGTYSLGPLFYREDKFPNLKTRLKKVPITKNMGWCDDVKSKKYNKLIRVNKKIRHEKMYRNDSTYDLLIPIHYNTKKIIKNKGSAIFIHLTKDYKPTAGCISLTKKDFLILLSLINKNTKIKIP
mgnify:FL=1